MPDLFCLLNHELTDMQKSEAVGILRVNKILNAPEEIENIWININPEGELNIKKLNIVVDWLKNNAIKNDYVLVQGEFGATFYIVDFCFKNGLIPIYATSRREYKEIRLDNGGVKRIHTFNHVQFRRYLKYEDM